MHNDWSSSRVLKDGVFISGLKKNYNKKLEKSSSINTCKHTGKTLLLKAVNIEILILWPCVVYTQTGLNYKWKKPKTKTFTKGCQGSI